MLLNRFFKIFDHFQKQAREKSRKKGRKRKKIAILTDPAEILLLIEEKKTKQQKTLPKKPRISVQRKNQFAGAVDALEKWFPVSFEFFFRFV